jgi:zinc-ribbon domain
VYESSLLGGYGIGFVIDLVIAIWVASDANKRGMNGIAWGIGVFLLCIVFLPIYLIVRKPLLPQPLPYGYQPPPPPPQSSQPYGYQPGPTTPPPGPPPVDPSQPVRHFCSNCGTQLVTGTKFCPSCGHAV